MQQQMISVIDQYFKFCTYLIFCLYFKFQMKSTSQTVRSKAIISQQILMSSLQRARQKISNYNCNISNKSQSNIQSNSNNCPNDQNNSIFANSRPTFNQKDKQNKNMLSSVCKPNEISQSRYEHQKQYSNSQRKQQKQIVAGAIKVLQDKISGLQVQNKKLSTQLQRVSVNQVYQTNSSKDKQSLFNRKIQDNQKRLKQIQCNHRLSARQCQTLKTQNQMLKLELDQQKELLSDQNKNGLEDVSINLPRKIQFQPNQNQTASISMNDSPKNSQELKIKQLQQKYAILLDKFAEQQQVKLKLKEDLVNQRKKSHAIIAMHHEEILRNETIDNQLKEKNKLLKEIKNKRQNRSYSNTQVANMQSYNLLKTKNEQLMQKNKQLVQQLKVQKENYRLIVNEINQKQQKYFQIYTLLQKICKDIHQVDAQYLSFKIRNSIQKFQKLKKTETDKLNLLKSTNNNAFMRYSISRQSGSKDRPKRKGLKMEDLQNSSGKKSNSKQHIHSRSSNRSQFKSPESLQQKRARIKTTNDAKKQGPKTIDEIQKVIKEIKFVNQQIKAIKNQHRNLTIILKKEQKINNESYSTAKQKFDQLTETYVQYTSKLQHLKKQKEMLSQEVNLVSQQ